MVMMVDALVLLLAAINLSLCNAQSATNTVTSSSVNEVTSTPASSSSVSTTSYNPTSTVSYSCPITSSMPSPTETVSGAGSNDKSILSSIPVNYLQIIVIVLLFTTVFLFCVSLFLIMGICIVCCRAHSHYSTPTITSPMMQSEDKLWKPIPKPLAENDEKYLEEETDHAITMDTFKKDHHIITPSHTAATPLINRSSDQNNATMESETTFSPRAKPYAIPAPNGAQSTRTIVGNGRHHSSTNTSSAAPIKVDSSRSTQAGAKETETSLAKSTSSGSLYMKMESPRVLQGKPYSLPDSESVDSVSYVDYILPTESADEEDYENASAVRLATALKNKSAVPPPLPASHTHPTAAGRKARPPEPKPKPSKNKPRKMSSSGLINPVLLSGGASEEPHYMSPRSASLAPDGYKSIDFKSLDTAQGDYTVPSRDNSLSGHADSKHHKPQYY